MPIFWCELTSFRAELKKTLTSMLFRGILLAACVCVCVHFVVAHSSNARLAHARPAVRPKLGQTPDENEGKFGLFSLQTDCDP